MRIWIDGPNLGIDVNDRVVHFDLAVITNHHDGKSFQQVFIPDKNNWNKCAPWIEEYKEINPYCKYFYRIHVTGYDGGVGPVIVITHPDGSVFEILPQVD